MTLLESTTKITLLDEIIGKDQRLFFYLNGQLTHPVLDTILPFFRETLFWIPLYLFVITFMLMNFGKRGLGWIIFILITVALCDMVSTSLIKANVMRLRPCQDPSFARYIRLLIPGCPSESSFTSTHASTYFGMATFFFLTLRTILPKWIGFVFLWAGLIAYAQVYVGVHYPLDILFGALVGSAVAVFSAGFFNRRIGLCTFGELTV
ncbi:MAG TPA: phosphatase PAP2 family protein [Parasegetibacter sp.]